jgi:hypothetical protein
LRSERVYKLHLKVPQPRHVEDVTRHRRVDKLDRTDGAVEDQHIFQHRKFATCRLLTTRGVPAIQFKENVMAEAKNEPKLSWQAELAKSISWPLFGVFIVFCFWSSLHRAANLVASAMVDSESITIGQLSIKITKLGIRPTPEVRDVLKDLSAQTINKLLELRPDQLSQVPPDVTSKSLNDRLIGLNLVKELSADQLADLSKRFVGSKFVYGVGLTPLGADVQSYVQSVTSEVIREAGSKDKSIDK